MNRRLLLVLLLVITSACRRAELPAREHDNTLVRRLIADVSTLNPVCAKAPWDGYVFRYLFTPLIDVNAQGQPIPGLASWSISPDGRMYHFVLDKRATFSDNTPVRATDVLFTLRKIAQAGGSLAGSFEQLDFERSCVRDAHTLDVAFREPLATQLMRFRDVLVLPEHVYATATCDDHSTTTVGSGPYTLTRHESGKRIILQRRAQYWREMPHIQTVIFQVVTDYTTAWNALTLGQLDETAVTSAVWAHEQHNPAHAGKLIFRSFYTPSYDYIAWNLRHPVLRDDRVRRALAMCIPVDTIIQTIFYSTARPLTGPFTPDEYAYNSSLPRIPYAPEQARQLLAAAGWHDHNGVLQKNGRPFTLSLLLVESPTSKQVAQLVQAEWQSIGISTTIERVDGTTQRARMQAGNYEAAYSGWELDLEPDPYTMFHSSQVSKEGHNFVFYRNSQADRLLEEARRELEQAKRQALYRRLHVLLAADQPYAWTFQVGTKWVFNQRVRGVKFSPRMGPYLWYPGELAWSLAPAQTSNP